MMKKFLKNFNKPDTGLATKKIQWKKALHTKNVNNIRRISSTVDEQDLADWIKEEPVQFQAFFLRSLKNLQASEVFNVLDDETLASIISTFTQAETKRLVSSLYSNDIIDKIEELPAELVYRLLTSISDQQRRDINYILNYPENSVGYEMNVDFIKTKLSTTVGQLSDKISSAEKTKIDQSNRNYYVTNQNNVLVGYVSSEALLAHQAKPETKISSIMEENVISVRAADDKNVLLRKLNKYNISEYPVVDLQNKLVGVLDAESAVQIFSEETAEDTGAAYGISPLETDENYFETSSFRHFLKRVPWLGATLLISTFSQVILLLALEVFDSQNGSEWLIKVLPYLPFMLALVGNIALQSSGVISKYIILGQINPGNYWKSFFKELKIVFFTLFFVIVITFLRNLFIYSFVDVETDVADKIGESLFVLLIIATAIVVTATVSTGLPILATWFKVDPALMASPILTALVDLIVTGLSILLAYLLLR